MKAPLSIPRQFALCSLFKLTLVAALALMLAVWCRDSPPKAENGVFSPWSLVSCLPAVIVFLVWGREFLSQRHLALSSIGLYATSLSLPAMAKFDVSTLGYAFAHTSVIAMPNAIFELFHTPTPERWFTLGWPASLAIIGGGSANVIFVLAYVAACFGLRWTRLTSVAKWASRLALSLALAAAILFMCALGWPTILPGCGLWIASMLALSLGAQPSPSSPSQEVFATRAD